MGKITKKATTKHDASLSATISKLVDSLGNVSLAELPQTLAALSTRWPYPRGDLYNWIDVLNRFDTILEDFNLRYGLTLDVQNKPFGIEQLLAGSPGADEKSLRALGFGPEGDRELIESILNTTTLLLEKCGNRNIYNGGDRLNDLLNTTSLSLLKCTLKLGLCLAQRYRERLRNYQQAFPTPESAYRLDLDKLHKLCSPITQDLLSAPKNGPPSPTKTTKSRDKSSQPAKLRRGSTVVNPNEFRSLCRETQSKSGSSKGSLNTENDWQQWGNVKLTFVPVSNASTAEDPTDVANEFNLPATPTPLRRQSIVSGSRLRRISTSEEPAVRASSAITAEEAKATDVGKLEIPSTELMKTSIEAAAEKYLSRVPQSARYELLHKLRVAYGLMTSHIARRQLLAIRLLAYACLIYVHPEPTLLSKLFGKDHDPIKRQQLVFQLVSLLQDGDKGRSQIPLEIQTLSMETLSALAKQKMTSSDIVSALGVNSNHGMLTLLSQRAVKDLKMDGDSTDNQEGDEWRDMVFSMLKTCLEATSHYSRAIDAFATAGSISCYASALEERTSKALRIHGRVVEFFKTYCHHVTDGLGVLNNNKAFDSLCDLLAFLTENALTLEKDGQGIPATNKTPATDFEIPYVHQQIIRAIVDLFNDVSTHQGTQADRVVRALIDSPTLLRAFHRVIENIKSFGPHTWSEVLRCVCSFLHYEPTSYTIIADAGLIRSILQMITMNENSLQASTSSQDATETSMVDVPDAHTEQTEVQSPNSLHTPSTSRRISCVPEASPQSIPATKDAIMAIASSFSAICLTSSGCDAFMASGALEKFFEIFETPAHIKALKAGNLLNILGSTFDELARHHQNLKPAVVSAIIVMIARVRYICQSMAWTHGVGPKMWVETEKGLDVAGGRESLLLDISPGPRPDSSGVENQLLQLPDGNFLHFPLDVDHTSDIAKVSFQEDNVDDLSSLDYMTAALGFLAAFFENQTLCTSFMDGGGTELVLGFATLPSTPDDAIFGPDGYSTELATITHMMTETKPHLVLPSLLQRAVYACEQAKHFAENQPRDTGCYFEPLVGQNLAISDAMEIDGGHHQYIVKNGTQVVKSLVAVYHLVQLISEIFETPIFNARSHGQPFTQVNLADIYCQLCDALGGLSGACIRESIALRQNIPDRWIVETQPKMHLGAVEDINSILGLQEPYPPGQMTTTASAALPLNAEAESNGGEDGVASQANAAEISEAEQTATFKNVHFLRHLLAKLPPSITTFFKACGRGIVGKRRMDTYQKQNAAKVANSIAGALKNQLCPTFFPDSVTTAPSSSQLDAQFEYLAVALNGLNLALFEPSNGPDLVMHCNIQVLGAFKTIGGMSTLTRIGTDFFDQLKRCELAPETLRLTSAANSGLKTCLQILDSAVSPKSIVESNQSIALKNVELSKPFYFQPAQLLLELRLEALPLTRLIWESEYADQASIGVVERLISILRHVFNGDHESDAYQNATSKPVIPTHLPKKLSIDGQKITNLTVLDISEDLAREALFRCHGNHAPALEYCRALKNFPTRPRCPVPQTELETPRSRTGEDSVSNDDQALPAELPYPDATVADLLSAIAAGDIDEHPASWPQQVSGVGDTSVAAEELSTSRPAASAMSLDRVLNTGEGAEIEQPSQVALPQYVPSVAEMNSKRESIRSDLAERCNDLLDNHHGIIFELADLILSGARKLTDEAAKTFRSETTVLLISALSSLQDEGEISESKGKKIAASAHLTALLLQDKPMFESAEGELRDAFETLLLFVRTSPNEGVTKEISFPWVGPVLLIVEKMLSRDAEPDKIEWRSPTDLEPSGPAHFIPSAILGVDNKLQLFNAIVEVLPHIGKDKSLALSVTRVLVILTRDRQIASLLAQKRNIQRLFVMVKQLATSANDRLQSALMLILRHVIEDEDTLRQIIKSEIISSFGNRSAARQVDTTTFVRELHHLALRSPKLFVEVANSTVRLQRYDRRETAQILVLKPQEVADTSKIVPLDTEVNVAADAPGEADSKAADSVEVDGKGLPFPSKGKNVESRPPVVEHPDGIIHFLLSELLSYKDVDDKVANATPATIEGNGVIAKENVSLDDMAPAPTSTEHAPPSRPKSEKSGVKSEDHPIYLYRCFLLQCLTELLLSYNRTKIEFINFSRKADPLASTPSKPRSGVLNYLLTSLVPGSIEMDDTVACKKKASTSSLAMKVIVALCSKTFEVSPSSSPLTEEDQDDEPDLTFVRRFVLEHAIKAFKDASISSESWEARYSRMLGLADLFNRLLTKASSAEASITQTTAQNSSFRILSRMMFEKNLISVLTSSLADIDLTFPGAKRVIKYILKPLNELTMTASRLSLTSSTPISSALGSAEEDISSASSVSEMEDTREETPDLYRNSVLGTMEPHHQDESSSESDDDDGEVDLYDDRYAGEYAEEMDFVGDGADEGPDDGEVVSDEEIDDQLQGPGHMEGLPGDVPMDLELVMNGGHDMDVDTDDDDEDEDEEDGDDEDTEDDDDDDDDGDDFDIEGDDDIDMGGEINADGENDSLGDGPEDGEDDWEDEGDGDEDEEVEFDDGSGPLPTFPPSINITGAIVGATADPQETFNNLLQAYNEDPADDAAITNNHLDAILRQGPDDDGAEEDEEDDDDEEDDMDEDMAFDAFDDMLEGHEDVIEQQEQWAWGEPSQPRHRGQTRRTGGLHSFLTRRIQPGAELTQLLGGGSSRRHAASVRPGGDDGTNPLLQRPSSSSDPNRAAAIPPIPFPVEAHPGDHHHHNFETAFTRAFRNRDGEPGLSVHGEMLDAVMHALHRGGDVDFLRPGRFQISFESAVPDIPRILRAGLPSRQAIRDETFRMMSREDQMRIVAFEARSTTHRWQEEVRILFGSAYTEIILRVQKALLSVLVPPAQAEEKVRRKEAEEEAERQKKQKQEELERRKREEEEREAAAKAEREAAAAAAAEAAERAAELAREAEAEAAQNPQQGNAEPMEGVEASDPVNQPQASGNSAEVSTAEGGATTTPRVFTTIRGRQLDITHMSIDAEYLEALPEEIREEVIMQQYAEQREQAQEAGGDANAIDPDFLDALPEDIREEIRQQEAHARRRRDREAARRQVDPANGPAQPEEMDNDNFLATLDPALRRAILAEQTPEILQQLDPRHAAEGRAHARHLFGSFRTVPTGRDGRDDMDVREHVPRDAKRQVVQMIDKSGVATLLRLMFLPHQGSLRQNLFTVLRNVCGHRQTRFEVISLLLIILKEGSTDVGAVEKSLASLSLRAKAASQKTPQPLKRTLSMQQSASISEEMTPVMVIQQCLAALSSLSRHDPHVKSIFLREVDVSSTTKSKSKKGKGKENKSTKYPLNDLLSLLDRKAIMENSICLHSFAELLAIVTAPLFALIRKEKSEESKGGTRAEIEGREQIPDATSSSLVPEDAPMTEAPADIPATNQPAVTIEEAHNAEGSVDQASEEKQDDLDQTENTEDEPKGKKGYDPPVLSDHNLQLVIGILVAQECGRETFSVTLDAIRSLSHIPGSSAIFSAELTRQAKTLSQSILGDLDDLLPLIRDSQSGTDLQGIASLKFTPTSSDQSKLLRILMALDYISAPKRAELDDSDDSREPLSSSSLNASYESLLLGPLWSKLSECLTAIREKENIFSFATILLPLIESLMVVCKNTSLKDAPLARQVREQSVTNPEGESLSDLEQLFFTFTTEHRKILNEIVRQNPKLMTGLGNFALLVKNPKVLEFDNKRNYFSKQIHSRSRDPHRPQPPLQLSVRRENVFLDSFKSLYFKTPEEMKYGKLNIRFHGEEGVDAGGVTREWFQVLARGMFNANYALWEPVASDKTTFHPSKLSGVNSEHLLFFKFIGRIIGKALHEGRVLDCHFSRAVYKKMLGKEPNLKDLESNDQDYYKSLMWILENDITDQFDAEFSVISENFGVEEIVDLIENGRNVAVTEENKHDYVQKLVEYRLTGSVKEQLENFLRGFHDIIPAELVAIFNEQELELLISGLPEIDVDDWKVNTEYHNYTASSQQIQWFWRAVRGMSQEARAKLLQFITGTSKVPLNGFKELEGIHGTTKTSIHRSPQKEQLPTSHTCFNQLDLPDYPTYEELRSKLMVAVHNSEGFGFA